MANDLKAELFNMKMKCHEYEQRLQLVQLHGIDGERMHKLNIELSEKVDRLESENMRQADEIAALKGILTRCNEEMPKLVAKNAELESNTSALKKQAERASILQSENKDLQLSATSLEGQLKDLTRKLEHSLSTMEKMNAAREQLLADKRRLEDALCASESKVSQSELLLDQIAELQEQVRSLNSDLENRGQNQALSNALHMERVEQSHHDKVELLTNEIATLQRELLLGKEQLQTTQGDCERYQLRIQLLREKEKTLNDELVELRFVSQNAETTKATEIQKLKQDFESQRDSLMDENDERLYELQQSFKKQLFEKEDELKKEEAKRAAEKQESREKLQQQKKRIVELEGKLETLEKKWKTSITAKRLPVSSSASKENIREASATGLPSSRKLVSKTSSSRTPLQSVKKIGTKML